MKISEYKSYDDLPLLLNAEMVSKVLGWPRRDPRHDRFAVPNTVWSYSLRPVEFVIFSYLCYHRAYAQSEEIVSTRMMAEGIHIAESTVKKYLDGMTSKGVLTGELRRIEDGKFFTLPNEIFLLRLPVSAFLVYAYLLLIEDRRTHTCHPSYNTIAAETGMSKNTAIKGISILLEMGLVTVEPSSYFDQRGMKWRGNNLYTIQPIQEAVELRNQRMLRQLEETAERMRAEKLMANREHPV